MKEETRRRSIVLFDLSWEHACLATQIFHHSAVHKWLWKYPKYWFEVTNQFRWAGKFTNTEFTNKEDWMYAQGQFNFCSITVVWLTSNKLFILSVCWFLLYLLNFCSTVKTPKPPLSPWGFSNNLSWGWIISFFPLSHHCSMDICHSLVTVPQMMALLLEQLYPIHPALLGSSSPPSLTALTATSWSSWSIMLCGCVLSSANATVVVQKTCLGFVAGVDVDRLISVLLSSSSKIFLIILPVLPL